MKISDIRPDDPEVANILLGMKQSTYTIAEIIANGPCKRTKISEEIDDGRLIVGRIGFVRFVTAIDYARWLLLLRRETEAGANVSDQNIRKNLERTRAIRKQKRLEAEAAA